MTKLIYIMGIDGSGKTTLSKNIKKELKLKGYNVKYLYARYRPFLIAPIKLIAKIFLYKKNTEFKNYTNYSLIKTNYSKKHKILAKLYALFCMIDYTIVSWPLVMIKFLFADYIIIDRYVGDLIVILAVASQLDDDEMLSYLKKLHIIFPFPKQTFLIEIDEDIAFTRKDDIPSIKYLKERKEKYYVYKNFYNYKILDGRKSKTELTYDLLKQLKIERDN